MTTSRELAHMSSVVGLGCLICGSPAEVHHIRRDPMDGLHFSQNQRATHFQTIPLCPLHHRLGPMGVAYHSGPRAWEAIHGTEIELWKLTNQKLRENAA